MKVLFKQFGGKNHSWAVVGWGLASALIQAQHNVHLFSTDGIEHLPVSLRKNLIGYTEEQQPHHILHGLKPDDDKHKVIHGQKPDDNYDLQISYTCMKNFAPYLSSGKHNRFGIWCYEWAGTNSLPTGFAKCYTACDALCAPSQFAKRVFLESKIPERVIKVIPHGINAYLYRQSSTIELPTKKAFKLLANIAQAHLRKNIPGLLVAYGKAFTNQDDVCLILKAKHKAPTMQFEIDLNRCLRDFNLEFPNHAEVKVYSEFIEDMSALYRSVDAVYTMTHCEGFFFPGLEGLATGKLSIAPNWGGQVDFLNTDNALLIDGKETRADPKSMYWSSQKGAIWFQPSIDDAVDKLRYAYQNFQTINAGVEKQRESVLARYDWSNIAQQFLDLCS